VADDQNPLIIFFTAGVVKKIDLLFFKKNEKNRNEYSLQGSGNWSRNQRKGLAEKRGDFQMNINDQ